MTVAESLRDNPAIMRDAWERMIKLSETAQVAITTGDNSEMAKVCIFAPLFSVARCLLPEIESYPKACPSCRASMELVRAEDGGEIEEPYFPKYPLRDQPLPRRRRRASFWACPSCEHCEEVA